jgi:DNA topoisomerase-3
VWHIQKTGVFMLKVASLIIFSMFLLATGKGFFLIEQVSKTAGRELFNPITTSEWEAKLQQEPLEFKELIQNQVRSNIMSEMSNNLLEVSQEASYRDKEKESLGNCPKCGTGNIYEGQKSFYCSRYKEDCKFSIWKEIAKSTITKTDVKALLSGKLTKPKTMTSRVGKPFTASLKLDEEFKTVFVFEAKQQTGEAVLEGK